MTPETRLFLAACAMRSASGAAIRIRGYLDGETGIGIGAALDALASLESTLARALEHAGHYGNPERREEETNA